LQDAYRSEMGETGFEVVLDYLWGKPTEALLATMIKSEFAAIGKETRLVQVGESAGAKIELSAALLRSTAVTILGTAGIPPMTVLIEAMQEVLTRGARRELRIETERVAFEEIESVWGRRDSSGKRLVLIP